MLSQELTLCLQSVSEYAYNIFSLSQLHQFDLFLDCWPQFLHIQMSKRNFFMRTLYISDFTRKFLVALQTFGLKLLVSVLVPVSENLNLLVSFRYPFWSYLGHPGFDPLPGNPLSFVPYKLLFSS